MKRILTTLSQKWPEYLLEILVITVGIIGAFALNNWNESRKEGILEQKIIKQLIEEYQSNLQQLEKKIEMRNSIISSCLQTLTHFDNPSSTTYPDLLSSLANIPHDPTFDPIKNDLLESGNLRIIQNEQLRKNLSEWLAEVAALQEMENAWQKVVEERLNPYLEELGLTRDLVHLLLADQQNLDLWLLDPSLKKAISITPSKKDINPLEILSHKKLEGLIGSAIIYNQFSNYQSFALRNKMVETIALLKQELQ